MTMAEEFDDVSWLKFFHEKPSRAVLVIDRGPFKPPRREEVAVSKVEVRTPITDMTFFHGVTNIGFLNLSTCRLEGDVLVCTPKGVRA